MTLGKSPIQGAALIACLLVILGSIGPWYVTALFDKAGLDSDGRITALFAMAAGGLVFDRPAGSNWLMLAGLLAVACAFVGGYHLVNIYGDEQELFGQEVQLIRAGWGLWLMTGAAIFLAVTSAALWIDNDPAEDR